MTFDPASAFRTKAYIEDFVNGKEPCLGGQLAEKAVRVDESACIGCRYCANVATNTFVLEPFLGRSRAMRQDGDTKNRIQEAIDTCPVDCIHWVPFEDLNSLQAELAQLDLQPLGLPMKVSKRLKPRNR